MPAGFRFLNEKADPILPFMFDRGRLTLGTFSYFALARLKPDVALTHASADIARMIPIWLNGWPAPAASAPTCSQGWDSHRRCGR